MSRDLAPDSFERALALYDLGRLEDAEEALRDALREEPDDPLTHGILALVLLDLDRGDEALQAASTTIALAPDVTLGHVARAQALLSLGRFDDAEASANEAIRLDPEDADGWVLLAGAQLGRKRWDDAVSTADKALSLDPESETARGLRAVALAMFGEGADWREAADGTLAVAPDSSLAHAYSGLSHLVGGGEREAAERFREALRLDPENEFAQVGLSDAMKATHPLFRPFFRFFLWQERLSRGWKIALTVGPLLVVRALSQSAADHTPLLIVVVALWVLFVAGTWMAVPIANLALRFSPVGRAVLPEDQKRSSAAFLAFMVAALVAVVLIFAVSTGFVLTAFACGLLAFSVGSGHHLGRRRKRIVYGGAIAAGVAAFVGGALINVRVGGGSLGAVILIAALFSAVALIWTVRLS
jgi:tetratricopeptide (TPR) repeat protein